MSELEIIQHPQLGGISIFFDTVEYRTPHFHPEWELIWITDGDLTVISGRREELCRKGELCLFAPKQLHEFRQRGAAATFLCLQIAPQVFACSYPALGALSLEDFCTRDSLSDEQAERIRCQLKALMGEYLAAEPYYELRCVEGCARILGELLSALPVRRLSEEEISHADRRSERLDRFLRYVDEHYTQHVSLEAFARQENCSVSYMSRFLKTQMNQSFQEYVNSVRFHCACRLIAAGGKRLIDVCEESGFSDYRYFSKCFKKYCGMTPEEYRRQRPPAGEAPAQRSLYSHERFYSKTESEQLLQTL